MLHILHVYVCYIYILEYLIVRLVRFVLLLLLFNYGHIVYGRPYCNDAKEGVGGITPPKLNRGG